MRIEELLVEQQLDELGIGQAASALGKGAAALGRGVVNVAPKIGQAVGQTAGSAIGGFGGGIVRGYKQARRGANPMGSTGDNSNQAAAPGVGNTAQAAQGQATAPTPAGTTQPTAGQTTAVQQQQSQAAQQQQKIGVGQINKIIPTLNSKQLASIKSTIDQRVQSLSSKKPSPTGSPAPTGLQTSTGTQPAAQIPNTSGSTGYSGMPPSGTIANQPTGSMVGTRTFEGQEFYSKFLGQKL